MLGRSIPKHALTSSDPCATAAVSVSFGWPGTSHAPAFFPTGGEDFYLPPGLRIRTLALLTIFLGAKLGANDRRHRAMSGHVQPFLGQMNSTSSHTRRRQAVFRECLLSSRSRVRVAVGAQIVLVDLRNRNYHRSSDVLLAGNHSWCTALRMRRRVRVHQAEFVVPDMCRRGGRPPGEPNGEPTSLIRPAGLNGPRSGTGEQGSYTGLATVTSCLQLLLLDGALTGRNEQPVTNADFRSGKSAPPC